MREVSRASHLKSQHLFVPDVHHLASLRPSSSLGLACNTAPAISTGYLHILMGNEH